MVTDSEAEKSKIMKQKVIALASIAKPLAGKKLCKALSSSLAERGVKEVVKSIRGGHKGLCIIVGNISPIDVIAHVPILYEEADIPYVYVPSKEDLATAGATKRPTCCVLALTKATKVEMGQEEQENLKADYDQVVSDVSKHTSSLFQKTSSCGTFSFSN